MDLIHARDISFSRKGKVLLDVAGFRFNKPEFVAIIGPNGAGKSTLLQLLSGYFTPSTGSVELQGKSLPSWSPAELASRRAYLQQQQSVFESFSVEEVLLIGRSTHFGSKPREEDRRMVAAALKELDLERRAGQPFNSLSGGEQQRVQFTRTLLQLRHPNDPTMEGKVLFLDEPLNNLDLYYQYNLLQTAREQVTAKGGCVIAVLHDLNIVHRFADRVIMLSEGKTLLDAPVEEAMLPELLSAVYKLPIQKIIPDNGFPYFAVADVQHGTYASANGETLVHKYE